jgi:hypothetical protein
MLKRQMPGGLNQVLDNAVKIVDSIKLRPTISKYFKSFAKE